MNTSRTIHFALVVIALAGSAGAQTPPHTLTLAEAVARAGAAPPSVRAAWARARAATAQESVARAGSMPTVSTTGSATMAYSDRPFLPATMGRDALRFESAAASIDASLVGRMNLYDFGRTANAVTAAEHGAVAARFDARAAARQAMAAAAAGYFTVLGDRQLAASVRATIAQREAHLRIAEGLVSAGARPPIERTRASVNLDAARLDLVAAEATERNDRAGLAAAVGIDPAVDIDLVPDPVLPAIDDDPARAADAAVASRPEFAAARARVAQTEAAAAAARAGRNPILAASATGTLNYTEVLTGNGLGGRSEIATGGLSLTWPVLDFTVRANIDVAEANAAAAREALAAQTLAVRTEAVQAALAVRGARTTLAQAERLAAVAAANLELASGRYEGGVAPLLEVVDAQAADATARVAVVRAGVSQQLARVRLLAAVGGLEALAR